MNSSTASALLAPTPVHEPIAPLLQTDLQGRTVARFGPFALESHFQPILSLAHGRTVGYEALLRGRTDTGLAISPRQILGHPRTFADRLLLDRLALNTHARNFLALDQRQHWLFLNVQEDVFLEGPREGAAVRELLESGVIPAHHIVLEVLERAVSDEVALQDAVDYYRRLGCLIALDDFGAGQSNFDRVWNLHPDIVKLDRQMTAQAATEPRVRRMMPIIVSLLHEAGSLVVMEGVETEAEALMAMDSDVDFVQGFYFARPQPDIPDETRLRSVFKGLWTGFREAVKPEIDRNRKVIAPYQNAIGFAASLMESGFTNAVACKGFLDLRDAERCYILDAEGGQIGHNLLPPGCVDATDARFAPLGDGEGANWSRRFYFRRAIQHPGRVQISRPYLSLASATQCVTLSVSLKGPDGPLVLCGDVTWRDRLPAFLE